MSAISRRPEADPLYAGPRPERAAYATGMLLDAQDFIDEQTYHRGRLARALAFLAGGGTLAGLEVTHRPADADQAEEIQVAPGHRRRPHRPARRDSASRLPAARPLVQRRDRARRRRHAAHRCL